MSKTILPLLITFFSVNLFGQTIEADPKDVSSVDGMIKAFYDAISGPAGQERDWERDKTLYREGIGFSIVNETDSGISLNTLSHQEFIDSSNDYLVENGFFEYEINRNTEQFGNTVHVWSTYEYRQTESGPVLGRGINSIQLYNDGKRWWITSAMWQSENENFPIPKEYLPK